MHLKTGEVLTGRLVDATKTDVIVDFGRGKPTRFSRANLKNFERNVDALEDVRKACRALLANTWSRRVADAKLEQRRQPAHYLAG